MKIIKTSDLRDGMKFDMPVYMDGENVFVPPGIPIRQKDIDRLLRWEIAEVRTEGSPVAETPKSVEPDPRRRRDPRLAGRQEQPGRLPARHRRVRAHRHRRGAGRGDRPREDRRHGESPPRPHQGREERDDPAHPHGGQDRAQDRGGRRECHHPLRHHGHAS